MLATKDELLEVSRLITELDFRAGQPYNALNIHGMRFGKYTALCISGQKSGKKRQRRWLCLCDCGSIKPVVGASLTEGNTSSCGCGRTMEKAHAAIAKLPLRPCIDCGRSIGAFNKRLLCHRCANRKYAATPERRAVAKSRNAGGKYWPRYRYGLHDLYIKKVLNDSFGHSVQWPQSMIDAKREHLKVKRLLKGDRA